MSVPTIEAYRRRFSYDDGPQAHDPKAHPGEPDLVTVVTVVRNGEKHIEAAIDSVVSQTYAAIEYIVVDGGSTDRTTQILERRSGDISRWISEPDEGIYDAINKGISLARGRYVRVLNSDDVMPPHAIETSVRAMGGRADAVVIGDVIVIDEQGKEICRLAEQRPIPFFPVFLHPSWMVPAAVYHSLGLYRTDMKVAADYEYFLRLRKEQVEEVWLRGDTLAYFRNSGVTGSGFRGVGETFRINRAYQGITAATVVVALQSYKRGRRRLLQRVLGRRNTDALYQLLHSLRKPRA